MGEPKKPEEELHLEQTPDDVDSPGTVIQPDQPADGPEPAAEEPSAPEEALQADGQTEPPQPAAAEPAVEPAAAAPQKPERHWFRPEVIFFPRLRRKLGKAARPLAVVIIILILGAGGGAGYWRLASHKAAVVTGSFKAHADVFKLVSTLPGNNATDVNTATDITLNFSQPVKAAKLVNNMFITPTVNGTFKQGKGDSQVVFIPAQPLTKGVKYSVMVNGTVQSAQGTQLGVPVSYGFTTSIADNAIDFADHNGLIDYVTSLASGQKETYTLYFGNNIGPTATITLYKGTIPDLLSSLVYTNTTTNGYTSSQFSDPSVSTSSLVKVAATSVKDKDTYSVQQPDGLYVVVATDGSGKEVGFVWVDVSNFGVMLRQDDQKTVLEAQSFSGNSDVNAQAAFYSLRGSVKSLGTKTLSGLTTANYGYDDSLDMVVATVGNETAVVPVNVPESGGDIRVDQNLSTAQAVYGMTDKPTYKAGDTVKFAGYVRLDNDAQYTKPGSGTVNLYVAQYKGEKPLASVAAPVDTNGLFSGSFTTDSSWLASGEAFDQFQLFAASVDGNPNNDLSVASFTEASTTNQVNNITVSFAKDSYLPNDTIKAAIKAVNASGQPLANASVQVHVFSEDYYENNLAANQANFGETGSELDGSPKTIQLDSNGQATYTVDASSLPSDGNSQLVTVQANLAGQSGVGAAGGDSAVVHQGNGYITFGTDRRQLPAGAALTSEVYVNQLDGTPMANSSVKYVLTNYDNSKQYATGSGTTDNNGLLSINVPSSQLASSGNSMVLKVTAQDQYGNAILSQAYFSVVDSTGETWDTSGAGLLDLNITGSSTNVKVGDTVNLTVNSPAALKALTTMDRGRIYKPAMTSLKQGNNTYSFTVTSDLAPSFTLTFSYFSGGTYHSEGVAFNVQPASGKARVSIQPGGTVTAGQSATFQIATTDSSGNPLQTSLIVDVVSSDSYALTRNVSPDIFANYYAPRPIMTSSSSSLSPVGSGGGRCGGGGAPLASFANAVGTTLYWRPGLTTAANGQTSVTFTPPKGSWTVTVATMSGDTQVGTGSATFSAN